SIQPPPGPRLLPYTTLFRSRGERIHQSISPMSRSRMDDEAGGLVDDEQQVVFVDDVQRHGMRRDLAQWRAAPRKVHPDPVAVHRSEEHTSELQSLAYLVCRL